MRILEIMPDFNLAGAEVMVENLSYYLAENNTVKVISMYDCDTAITRRMQDKHIDLVFLGKSAGFDVNVIKKLRKIIEEFTPDVIHTHRYMLMYAIFAGGMGGKRKLFHTVHNVAEKEVPKRLQMFQTVFFRTGRVTPIAISPLVKDSIVKHYGLKPDRVPMIFNGVDLSSFIAKSDYSAHEPFTCIHIGRFSEQKNHEAMLQAMRMLLDSGENVRFIFLGEGEWYDQILEKANEMGVKDKIDFAGAAGDIRPWLDKADVFILPSKWEGMPITLIETMADGMPIIAAKVGGVPDMITDGENGLLIEPNAEELVRAISTMKESTQLRTNFGKAAKEDSKRFDLAMMGNGYYQVFGG